MAIMNVYPALAKITATDSIVSARKEKYRAINESCSSRNGFNTK